MVFSSSTPDFGFKIDFARNTQDPARIFRALSELIKFCNVTDETLIKNLDIDIKHHLILEDIEPGSIVVWLKYIFEPIDNFKKIDFRLVTSYFVKAKSCIIEFINPRNTVNNRSELLNLQERLQNLAKETQTNPLGIYNSVSDKDLVSTFDSFQSATSNFQDFDEFFYLIGESKLPVNRNFCISEEKRESLLIKDKITKEDEIILKVKKPDYLGESKWQFRYNNRIIEVKIQDSEWLKSFQDREFVINPGDAIKAKVEVTSKFDFSGKVVFTEYILKALRYLVCYFEVFQLLK